MSEIAAIDCGTNSIKLLIGDLPAISVRESRMVRLGQGVDATGSLAEEALARTFAAVDEYAALIAAHGVDRVRFCATSATRDARNAEVFTAGVRERLGVVPEVLSGDEEAALVFAGATRTLARPAGATGPRGRHRRRLDRARPRRRARPTSATSMDIGAVRLHERHLHDDPPTRDQVAACVADIDRSPRRRPGAARPRALRGRDLRDDQDAGGGDAGPAVLRPRRDRRRGPGRRGHRAPTSSDWWR